LIYCTTCGGRAYAERISSEGWQQCVHCAALYCPDCLARLQTTPEGRAGFACTICFGPTQVPKKSPMALQERLDP
jgi:hypothetical protein